MGLYASLKRLLRIASIKNKILIWALRKDGAIIGAGSCFFDDFFFHGEPHYLRIGKSCTVNQGVFFQCWSEVSIGDGVHLSPYVQIYTAGLKELPSQRMIHESKPITIGNNVWMGANSLVLGGVIIGEGSIIGAHSLVVSDIPPFALAVGVPAKVIKTIACGEHGAV